MEFKTHSLENILFELDILLEKKQVSVGEYAIIGLLLKLYEEALEARRSREKIMGPTSDMVNELNRGVHKLTKKMDKELEP